MPPTRNKFIKLHCLLHKALPNWLSSFSPVSYIQPSPFCSLPQEADLYELTQPTSLPSGIQLRLVKGWGDRGEKGQDIYSLGPILCGCPWVYSFTQFSLPPFTPFCVSVCITFLGCHTNYHKFNGLKQWKFVSQFRRLEFCNPGVDRVVISLVGRRKDPFLLLSSCWCLLQFLGL